MDLKHELPTMMAEMIGNAVGDAVARPDVPISKTEAPVIARALATDVTEQIRENRDFNKLANLVAHVTSTEPWYRSRANWSAIVAAVTPMISLAGYNLSPEDQASVAGVLMMGGCAVSAYLARRARTATAPLGA